MCICLVAVRGHHHNFICIVLLLCFGDGGEERIICAETCKFRSGARRHCEVYAILFDQGDQAFVGDSAAQPLLDFVEGERVGGAAGSS